MEKDKYRLWLGTGAILLFICSYPLAEIIFPVDIFDRLGLVSTANAVAFALVLIVARFATRGLTRFIYSLGIGLVISYAACRIIDPLEEFRGVDILMIVITSIIVFYDYSKLNRKNGKES